MKTSHIDVLVVGAGPTGLTMAAELARHGIYCRIIDKAPLPSQQSKAFGIHARTLEIFENMGIIEAVLSMGNQCQSVGIYDQGRPLTSIRFDHIHTNYPYFFILAQSDTERILTGHLEGFGISIEREKTLKDFTQNETGVVATLELSDGTLETIHDGKSLSFRIVVPSTDQVTVLVVDDNLDQVHFYWRCAAGTRYRIIHAAQGQRTVQAIQAIAPEVIILDILLPDVDGWELLEKLHSHPATRAIPVIVCSIIAEEDLALVLGAALYLSKPIQHTAFIQALTQVLDSVSTGAMRA